MFKRNRLILAALATTLTCFAIADASAQPMSDRLRQAIDASTRVSEPVAATGTAGGQAAGTAPIAAAPIRMGMMSADPSMAAAVLGWNYYTASNCFSVLSNSTWVYTMNMTNGASIWLSDIGTAAYLGSACTVNAGIAVHVVTVSGTSFTWDAMGFAR